MDRRWVIAFATSERGKSEHHKGSEPDNVRASRYIGMTTSATENIPATLLGGAMGEMVR